MHSCVDGVLRSEQLHGLQGGGALPRGEQGGGYQQTRRERDYRLQGGGALPIGEQGGGYQQTGRERDYRLQGGGALPRGKQGGGYQQTGREIIDNCECRLFYKQKSKQTKA